MDGRKKFRSSVIIVKNALRFLIKSERKNIEGFHQKRKLFISKIKFHQILLFQVFRMNQQMFV
jgi:hypothetical protein